MASDAANKYRVDATAKDATGPIQPLGDVNGMSRAEAIEKIAKYAHQPINEVEATFESNEDAGVDQFIIVGFSDMRLGPERELWDVTVTIIEAD
jgi:hypothetical protein